MLAQEEAELLTRNQLQALQSQNFINHLLSNKEHYNYVIEIIESVLQTVHVYEILKSEYITMLEVSLPYDPTLNKYIDGRVYIGENVRPLCVALFAKLLVFHIVEGKPL
jgi:hypothetical protein